MLIETAREAFFRKGYSAVSMRELALQSGVGLSNIYNYFRSKEDLLAAVLQPLLTTLKQILNRHNKPENLTVDVFDIQSTHLEESIKDFLSLTTQYRNELKLLFLHAHQTCFDNFWQQWSEQNTVIGEEYMKLMKQKYPHLYTDVSTTFMRFSCGWWINMLREIALQDHLSKEEIKMFIQEATTFSYGGWKRLMKA